MPSLGEKAEKTLPQGKALWVKGLMQLGSGARGSRDPCHAPHLAFSVIS